MTDTTVETVAAPPAAPAVRRDGLALGAASIVVSVMAAGRYGRDGS